MSQNLIYGPDETYETNRVLDADSVAEVRSMLQTLEVGQTVQYAIPTQKNVPSVLTVDGVHRDTDGEDVRLTVRLAGPRDGTYYITDHPGDDCPHAISQSKTGSGPQGPVLALRLLAGDHSAF